MERLVQVGKISNVLAIRQKFFAASCLLLALVQGARAETLSNDFVVVIFDEKDNAWSAKWSQANVSLEKVGFAVEVDGKTLKPKSPETKVVHSPAATDLVQTWTDGVEVTRWIKVPMLGSSLTLSARVVNRTGQDVRLNTQHLIDLYSHFRVGDPNRNPASVYIAGASELQCLPADSVAERDYASSQVLGLVNRSTESALVVGFLTASQARADLSAKFKLSEGGVRLLAHQPFIGRVLGAGESIDLDSVYVNAESDPYAALEHYGDAVAEAAKEPVRTKPTALWCSWYAHRMAMSEELVLSNAAVAAQYFKPLGFEIMQMDHGWQRGDVTGDWVPNERFPHGLKWLSEQLQSRYGLRLGAWIAPTDVAETSETFQKHRDWMLKDGNGQPLVNWKWYWKPNPNCYELDGSNPEAAKWIEQTFAQLTSWGVSYYKIDFIAASAGEHFVQSDPKTTRGWGVMRDAMQALRRGAGPEAWIRYCQTPPVLSAGLADSVIGGTDTLDAGLNGNIEVLRSSARSLAAGYWLNERVYHREVCDMSVRMQADIEETRLRMAIMTLAGCSISFSDELQYLPLSRIRMMQACLPPGNPPMKPLDLFERAIPSIWRVHCKNDAGEWDVVGLFNFENKPEERTFELSVLGFKPEEDATVFEFWEQKFLGLRRGKVTITLPPQSSRILSLHKLEGRPQVIATDMHLVPGYHELTKLGWDDKTHVLSGECKRMPGVNGQLFVHVPQAYRPHFDFPLNENSAALTHIAGDVWAHEMSFTNTTQTWRIPFDR
ncbi:MAG TPA: alpha-galactosidase [Candidatus Dormibacteraeota bacterium]|nr:alpha-galactosidase [Candidatus Dormibacteraeota bacterium]